MPTAMSKDKVIPLFCLLYAALGLSFLRHRNDGFTKIPRDQVYFGVKALVKRHPEYFDNIAFTELVSGLHYSSAVEDTIFRLLGGILEVRGPKYQYLGFVDGQLEIVETKLADWLDPQTRTIVEQLAEEFYEAVKDGKALSA